MARDYKDPKVICCANLNYYKFKQNNRVYSLDGIAPTLDTCGGGDTQAKIKQDGIYRKLTPKEYFRLMGFEDSDYEKLVEAGMSKTQLYKMAGNSIVVNVVQAILKQIIDCKII